MEIKFLTTHCPMCKGVEMLLKKKNIKYIEVYGEKEIQALGFTHAPVLLVDGTPYVGREIHNWINNFKSEEA